MADLGKIVKEAILNSFLDKSPAELAKTRHYGLGGTQSCPSPVQVQISSRVWIF